jgi:hypothetical protein
VPDPIHGVAERGLAQPAPEWFRSAVTSRSAVALDLGCIIDCTDPPDPACAWTFGAASYRSCFAMVPNCLFSPQPDVHDPGQGRSHVMIPLSLIMV